jgi:hypothetical protein
MDIHKEGYLQSRRKGRIKMSVLSKWVRRQISKRGMKGFILKVVDLAVRSTPSKKDDEMLAKIKAVLKEFK